MAEKKPKCNASTLAEVPTGVKPVFCKLAPEHEGQHEASTRNAGRTVHVKWER